MDSLFRKLNPKNLPKLASRNHATVERGKKIPVHSIQVPDSLVRGGDGEEQVAGPTCAGAPSTTSLSKSSSVASLHSDSCPPNSDLVHPWSIPDEAPPSPSVPAEALPPRLSVPDEAPPKPRNRDLLFIIKTISGMLGQVDRSANPVFQSPQGEELTLGWFAPTGFGLSSYCPPGTRAELNVLRQNHYAVRGAMIKANPRVHPRPWNVSTFQNAADEIQAVYDHGTGVYIAYVTQGFFDIYRRCGAISPNIEDQGEEGPCWTRIYYEYGVATASQEPATCLTTQKMALRADARGLSYDDVSRNVQVFKEAMGWCVSPDAQLPFIVATENSNIKGKSYIVKGCDEQVIPPVKAIHTVYIEAAVHHVLQMMARDSGLTDDDEVFDEMLLYYMCGVISQGPDLEIKDEACTVLVPHRRWQTWIPRRRLA